MLVAKVHGVESVCSACRHRLYAPIEAQTQHRIDAAQAAKRERAAAAIAAAEARTAVTEATSKETDRAVKKLRSAGFRGHLSVEGGHFECPECGRWTDLRKSLAARSKQVRLIEKAYEPVWGLAIDRRREERLRPALIQRATDLGYEEAVAALEQLQELGLLATGSMEVGAPTCPKCYERASRRDDAPAIGERESIPPRLRFMVLQRDAFRCVYCGRSAQDGAKLHVDHVIPVVAGGKTVEGNLVTACAACNFGKSAGQVV